MKKFIFLFLITNICLIKEIISQSNIEEINCKLFNNCFNCSVCGNYLVEKCPCTWKNNSCDEVSYNPIITNWIYYYENCEDYSSMQIQKEYCGETEYSNNNKKSSISLPEKNGYYGLINLFCTYTYVNIQNSKTKFNINIHLNEKYIYNNNKIYMKYIIYYYNHSYDMKTISNNDEKLSYEKISSFQFFIMSNDEYDDNPFTIQITYSNGLFIDQIYIIFGIIILFIFICVIVIYCCTKKYNNRYRNLLNRNRIIINTQQNYEEIQRENNKKIIDTLLSNPSLLGERICVKEFERYGTNCTICLEELKINIDKVCLTPCNHVFHFKCVSDWLNKNLLELNLKCPNCNFDLSTMIQNESIRNSDDRTATSNDMNYIPNNDNQNLNNNNNNNNNYHNIQFNNFARISNSNNSNNTRTVNNRYDNENNNIINNNQISNNIQNRIIRENLSNRNIQSIKSIDNLESINI